MEFVTKDMEKNDEDIVALSEVAEQKLSEELIGKFHEEITNCKTKKE